jgi:hypothetical protein
MVPPVRVKIPIAPRSCLLCQQCRESVCASLGNCPQLQRLYLQQRARGIVLLARAMRATGTRAAFHT